MSVTKLEKECAKHIKEALESDCLMTGFLKKYRSFGAVKGSYVLYNPTDAECLFLRGLFKKDFSQSHQISVSLQKFEKAFEGTIYDGITLEGVLEAYFEKAIISNKEASKKALMAVDTFFENVILNCKHRPVIAWIEFLKERPSTSGYQWIRAKFNDDEEAIFKLLLNLDELVQLLEKDSRPKVRQVAAVKITKNAHALDDKKPLWRLLLYYLAYKENVDFPEKADEVRQLLFLGNIIDGDLHNTVITYGFEGHLGISKSEMQMSDILTSGWNVFYERGEPLVLSMVNLNALEDVMLCNGEKQVYCFENPAAFYTYIQTFPKRACVCTSGQITQCGYCFLELLENANVKVYYHGDYDPEGFLIADRLNQRFSNVVLYGYEKSLYKDALSNETISPRRLKQLDNLKSNELLPLAEMMKMVKRAAYEEAMLDVLLKGINPS